MHPCIECHQHPASFGACISTENCTRDDVRLYAIANKLPSVDTNIHRSTESFAHAGWSTHLFEHCMWARSSRFAKLSRVQSRVWGRTQCARVQPDGRSPLCAQQNTVLPKRCAHGICDAPCDNGLRDAVVYCSVKVHWCCSCEGQRRVCSSWNSGILCRSGWQE